MRVRHPVLAIAIACLSSCGGGQERPQKITVGAAANLMEVFAEVGRAFKSRTGIDTVFSYGATAELAQQIVNGAPLDVFAAADKEHVDGLVSSRRVIPDTRAVYAIGQLALWIPRPGQDGIPDHGGIKDVKELVNPRIRFIAVANPKLAPYGLASIEAMKRAGIWQTLEPRVVYTNTISQAKQTAASGNADVAFTSYSLVIHEGGTVVKIDQQLYSPIEQALAIVASSQHVDQAKQFCAFLLGSEGRAILTRNGYLVPPAIR